MAGDFMVQGDIRFNTPNIKPIVDSISRQFRGINASVNITTPNITPSLKGIGTGLDKINASLTNVSKNNGLDRLGSEAENANKKIRDGFTQSRSEAFKFGEAIGNSARRFTAFSLAAGVIVGFVQSLRQGVSAAIDFQNEMVRLRQVGNDTSGVIAGISDEIGRLSTKFGASSSELSKAAVTLRQAGLSTEDTKVAMEALAESSLAPTFDDMDQAVEGSIAAMQQFNIEAKDLHGFMGSLNKVSADFAVESTDLIHALRRSGGAFKAAGGDVNELMAMMAAVRSTTRESSETIATGFNTIFARIQRTDTVDRLKQLGIELRLNAEEARAFGKTEGDFAGPYEAIRRISSALKDVSAASPQYSAIVEEIGGFRQVSKVVPLIQQFPKIEEALSSALSGTTSLTQSTIIAQDSLAVQLGITQERFLDMFRTIGNNEALQSFAKSALVAANALASILKFAEPLVPLLTILATTKAISFGANIFRNDFTAGLKSGSKRNQLFASGGAVAAGSVVPGVGNNDTVSALLQPGEFVLNKAASQAIGYGNLYKMSKFATGGRAKARRAFKPGVEGFELENRTLKTELFPANSYDDLVKDEARDVLFSKESQEDAEKRKKKSRYAGGGKINKKRGYVFDFDDVLSRTNEEDAKEIEALKQAKDFKGAFAKGYMDRSTIDKSVPTSVTKLAAKRSEKNDVYILTARSSGEDSSIKNAIMEFASKYKINVKDVITTGDDKETRMPGKKAGTTRLATTQEKKRKYLETISSDYDEVKFYDDKRENIDASGGLGNVFGRMVRKSRFALGGKANSKGFAKYANGGLIKLRVGTETNEGIGLIASSGQSAYADLSQSITGDKIKESDTINNIVSKYGIDPSDIDITGPVMKSVIGDKAKKAFVKQSIEPLHAFLEKQAGPLLKMASRVQKRKVGIRELMGGSAIGILEGILFESFIGKIAKAPQADSTSNWEWPNARAAFSNLKFGGEPIADPQPTVDYLDAKRTASSGASKSILKKAANTELFDKKQTAKAINTYKKTLLPAKKGLTPKKKADGGSISAGEGNSVPALLTPGEFVFSEGAARNIGYGKLHSMNASRSKAARFANGGRVSPRKDQKFMLNVEGKDIEVTQKEARDYLDPKITDPRQAIPRANFPSQAKTKKTKAQNAINDFRSNVGQIKNGTLNLPLNPSSKDDSVGVVTLGKVNDAGFKISGGSLDNIEAPKDLEDKLKAANVENVKLGVTRHVISTEGTDIFKKTIAGPVLNSINSSFDEIFPDMAGKIRMNTQELAALEGPLLEKFIGGVSKTYMSNKSNETFDFPGGLSKNAKALNNMVIPKPVTAKMVDAKRSYSGTDAYNVIKKYLTTKRSLVEGILDGKDPKELKAADKEAGKIKRIGAAAFQKAAAGEVQKVFKSPTNPTIGPDKIAARLTPGEFVFTADTVNAIGAANLDELNKKPRLFADGGIVPWKYKAKDQTGKESSGTIDAKTEQEAKDKLFKKGLIASKIEAQNKTQGFFANLMGRGTPQPGRGQVSAGGSSKFTGASNRTPVASSGAKPVRMPASPILPDSIDLAPMPVDNTPIGHETAIGMARRGVRRSSPAYKTATAEQGRASVAAARGLGNMAEPPRVSGGYATSQNQQKQTDLLRQILQTDQRVVTNTSGGTASQLAGDGKFVKLEKGVKPTLEIPKKEGLASRLGGKKLLGGAAVIATQYAPQLAETFLGTAQKPGAGGEFGAKVGAGLGGAIQGIGAGVTTGALVGGPVGAVLGAVTGLTIFASSLMNFDKEIKELKFAKEMESFGRTVKNVTEDMKKPFEATDINKIKSGFATISKEATDSGNRKEFLSKNLDRSNIQAVSEKLIRDMDLSGNETSDERVDKFLKAGDGLGRVMSNLTIEADGVSFNQFREEMDKTILKIATTEKRVKLENDLNNKLDIQIRGFERLSMALEDAADSASRSQASLESLSGMASGIFAPTKNIDLGDSLKLGSDPTEFKMASSAVTNLIPNIPASLGNTVNDINDLMRVLPSALNAMRAMPLTEGSVGKALRTQIGNTGFDVEGSGVVENLVSAMDQMGSPVEIAEAIKKNVNGFADELSKKALPNVIQTFQDGGKQLTEQFDRFDTGLARIREMAVESNANRFRADQIGVEKNRAAAQFQRANTGVTQELSLPTLEADFIANQRRLAPGDSGFDVNALSARLNAIPDEIAAQTNVRDTATDRGQRETAQLKIGKLAQEANNANQALKNLGDSSARVAVLQEKIADIEQERTQRLSLAEKLITGSPADVRKIQRSAQDANVMQMTGNAFAVRNPERRKAAFDFMNETSNFQNQNGMNNGDIRELLIRNAVPGTANLSADRQQKLEGMQAQVLNRLQMAADAQNALAQTSEALQTRFFSQLLSSQNEFFDKLGNSFKESEKLDVQTRAGSVEADLVGARTNQAKAREFKGLDLGRVRSISKDPNFIAAQEAKTKIAEIRKIDINPKVPNRSQDFNELDIKRLTQTASEKDVKDLLYDVRAEFNRTGQNASPGELYANVIREFNNTARKGLEGDYKSSAAKVVGDPKDVYKLLNFEGLNVALKNFENISSFEELDKSVADLTASLSKLEDRLLELGGTPKPDFVGPPAPVITRSNGGPIPLFRAAGGSIFQPRGTDIVPAMLTPGEFVVNADATRQNYDLLNAINSGTSYFRNGGSVQKTKDEELFLRQLEKQNTPGLIKQFMPTQITSMYESPGEYIESGATKFAESLINVLPNALGLDDKYKFSVENTASMYSGAQDDIRSLNRVAPKSLDAPVKTDMSLDSNQQIVADKYKASLAAQGKARSLRLAEETRNVQVLSQMQMEKQANNTASFLKQQEYNDASPSAIGGRVAMEEAAASRARMYAPISDENRAKLAQRESLVGPPAAQGDSASRIAGYLAKHRDQKYVGPPSDLAISPKVREDTQKIARREQAGRELTRSSLRQQGLMIDTPQPFQSINPNVRAMDRIIKPTRSEYVTRPKLIPNPAAPKKRNRRANPGLRSFNQMVAAQNPMIAQQAAMARRMRMGAPGQQRNNFVGTPSPFAPRRNFRNFNEMIAAQQGRGRMPMLGNASRVRTTRSPRDKIGQFTPKELDRVKTNEERIKASGSSFERTLRQVDIDRLKEMRRPSTIKPRPVAYRASGGPIGSVKRGGSSTSSPAQNISLDQTSIEAINGFAESSQLLSGFAQSFTELIGPLNVFSQNIQVLRTPFDNFNIAATNLSVGLTQFSNQIPALVSAVQALANFPTSITLNGAVNVSVAITGAEAMRGMADEITNKVVEQVSERVKSDLISDFKNGNILGA